MSRYEKKTKKPGRPKKQKEAEPASESTRPAETVICRKIISGNYASTLCIGDAPFTAQTLGCTEADIRHSNATGIPVATSIGMYAFSIVKGERNTVSETIRQDEAKQE